MVSGVQLPPEIQLAQRLAGNEKVTRDRAVRKLRKYITARTQRDAGKHKAGGFELVGAEDLAGPIPSQAVALQRSHHPSLSKGCCPECGPGFSGAFRLRKTWNPNDNKPVIPTQWIPTDQSTAQHGMAGAPGGFTHDELLKVWKGLFYCMWMQDKPLLQEELGRTIAQLIHAFQNAEAQHLFIQTFWQTMNREWIGIDRLRLDKYYLLMRMVLNESLRALQMRDWEESHSAQLLKLLMTEILHPDSQAPHGVKNHFTEIFLEELAKVGAKQLTADQNLKFIDPFCKIAARTKNTRDLHSITRGIFETIVEQAPFAIEELMNELDEQEGEPEVAELSDDGGLLEESDLEEEEEAGVPTRKLTEVQRRGSLQKSEEGEDEDGAGSVLQFDYEAVANRLFEMASRQKTPSLNRKRLYKVVRKLQALSAGIFPEDDVPEKVYAYRHEGRLERQRKKRLLKSQVKKKGKGGKEESPAPGSRTERRKTRRRGRRSNPDVQPEGAPGGQRARSRKRGKPSARTTEAASVVSPEPKKKKQRVHESQE
ncbi:ribosomal RNA processing protein 1 homolog A isoform X1 [Echinops telfairi]|uniref:Ribosomal RNA processing protein 1 homolog A isoform X1 n=1 Tax=Echinops telfairi TaxID=9371 RepID=A0AC55CLF8_ECHTE|nr:ribosomal RNA processing protein 1 homolog A isoform X1 [Echinops telfairi]